MRDVLPVRVTGLRVAQLLISIRDMAKVMSFRIFTGLRLVGLGCVMAPGAGAGRRMVWKGSGWRLSELGATGSGAEGGA